MIKRDLQLPISLKLNSNNFSETTLIMNLPENKFITTKIITIVKTVDASAIRSFVVGHSFGMTSTAEAGVPSPKREIAAFEIHLVNRIEQAARIKDLRPNQRGRHRATW